MSWQLQAQAILELRKRGETTGERDEAEAVAWILENFYIPELSGPIALAPYQQAVLGEAHRRDGAGRFVYNVVVWSDVKKSAKSSIAAAVALYRARHIEWGNIKIIANDLKQADSRVAKYFRRALELNPEFTKGGNYRQSGYTITFLDNHTEVEAIPIDPAGEAGGNDDLIIFSELWAAKHKALQQMWTEMTLSPMKFGHSQRWVETYAGYSGESPILEQLHERGVKQGQRLDLSYEDEATGVWHDLSDLEVHAEGDMLCLWNTRPRLDWQTNDYYASEESVLTPNEFLRVHRNQWVTSVEKFIQMVWWDACREELPPLTAGEPMVIALDAATGGQSDRPADCFAMIGVTRHPQRRQDVAVRYCGIWIPAKGQLLDFGPIEAELKRLCQTFSVVEVGYDPYQLHRTATDLRQQGLAHFKEFDQGKARLLADKQLQQLIIARRVAHDGNPLLREHLDNANVKNQGEDGIRLVKRTEAKKIDAAVALSMATARALYLNLG